MNKQQILKKIQARLNQEAESLARGAMHAHSYATNSESKSEGKYDTRGLEASYLAEGQAKLAAASAQAVSLYSTLTLQDFSENTAIALTALVELEYEGKHKYCFIGPKNGGITIEHEGCSITLITPTSPLGQLLIGRKEGDYIEVITEHSIREYDIISVR